MKRQDEGRVGGEALRRSLYFTMIAWIPGAFWQGATSGAPVIELANHFKATDFVFSLLMAAPLVSVLFQLPGSMWIEWMGARKKFFIWTLTPHRALYVLLGLLPWIFPAKGWAAMVMVWVVFVSMSLSNLGGPAWADWMADLVPERMRGKYFAARCRMGIAVMCVAGLGVAELMDLCRAPWFERAIGPAARWAGMPPLILLISVVFMVSGLVGMMDILSFTKVDEPRMEVVKGEPWLGRLGKPLRDGEFMRFIAYWSVWTAANAFCGWMWWVYLLDFMQEQTTKGRNPWWGGHMYVAATIVMSLGFQVGQFLGYPMWGRAVDRFGRKPVLFVSSVLHTVCWVWWIFLSTAMLPWLFLTQMFGGFVFGGSDIASFNMMLQFSRRGGPGYQAVGSVIVSLAGGGAMILAGKLAETINGFTWTFAEGTRYEHTFNHYAVLIVIGMCIKYLGDLVFLPAVRDVGGKRRSHALRFVFQNTYGGLNTRVFKPIRAGTRMAGRGLDGMRETLADAAAGGIRKFLQRENSPDYSTTKTPKHQDSHKK